jgi:hypothetical protein
MDDSKDPKDKPHSPKRILESGSELKKALAVWDELSKEPPATPPDEQVLNDVKDLLKQLKSQIEQFK